MTAQELINAFKELLNEPYVWGGESRLEGGFDCSGALYAASKRAGYNVARLTAQGYSFIGKKIPVGEQMPGDCLFFGSSITHITHCALYIGNELMIESRGSRQNTKNNPGTGVTISSVNRRSDLRVVRRWWDESECGSVQRSIYKVGCTYTVQVNHLHVRWSAGGNIKSKSELTADGMNNAFDDGCLKKGTRVTCKEVVEKDNCVWIKIPSGWCCAVNGKDVYIK
jgi:hypothetical protein